MYRTGISIIVFAAFLMLADGAPSAVAQEPQLLEAPPFQAAPRPMEQDVVGKRDARNDFASPASFQAPVQEAPSPNQRANWAGAGQDQRSAKQSPQFGDGGRSSAVQAAAEAVPAPQDLLRNPMRTVLNLSATASSPPATAEKSPPATAATAPLSISQSARPKPLAPANKVADDPSAKPTQAIDSILTVVGGLGIVVGLFLVTMWSLRKSMPKHTRALPEEVVEVLGRARLSGRQQMHLIRFGSKLVLAAVSPGGVDTISEITESEEVDRLAGHCQAGNPFSASNAFRGLLAQLEEQESQEPSARGRRRRGLTSLFGSKTTGAEDEYV